MQQIAHAVERVRETAPLVQCITNTVVQQVTANALLACGASPAMLDHEADAAQFARIANGILVNFGTATSHQLLAADAAIAEANALGTPWVLDPVSVGGVDYRTTRIRAAAAQRPTAVRGNASEIAALAGHGAGGRGVDATDEVDAVLPAAVELSRALASGTGVPGSVIAVSGPVDAIVRTRAEGGADVVRVGGGSDLMPLVIGTGCSLGAVAAAYLGAADRTDPDAALWAVAAAHAHFAAAGARAAESAQGPGSFAVAFVDALHALAPEEIAAVPVTAEVRSEERS